MRDGAVDAGALGSSGMQLGLGTTRWSTTCAAIVVLEKGREGIRGDGGVKRLRVDDERVRL